MVLVEQGYFGKQRNTLDCDTLQQYSILINSFYIGKYELTFKQFEAFVEETGYITEAEQIGSVFTERNNWEKMKGVNWRCNKKGELRKEDEKNHPVTFVSWNDAVAYCKWLSRITNKLYRLPTEMEWEFAARGGVKSVHRTRQNRFAGSDEIDYVAWYASNSRGGTHPVGTKIANEIGVYDMSGNVWEWCLGWYDIKDKTESNCPLEDGIYRLLKGGCWCYGPEACQTALRFGNQPIYGYSFMGFRVMLEIDDSVQ